MKPREGDCANQELIERAQKGDTGAIDELISCCRQNLVTYCKKNTQNTSIDFEDIVSETLYRACESISSFKKQSKFCTWLIGISKYVFLDEVRKAGRRITGRDENFFNDALVTAGFIPVNDMSQFSVVLRAALKQELSERNYQIVVLLCEMEMTSEEVGEQLGMKASAVRKAFERMRPTLEKIWHSSWEAQKK